MRKIINYFGLRKYQVNPEGGMIFVDRKVEKWLDKFKTDGYSGKSEIEIELYRKITKSGFEDDQEIVSPRSLPKISLVVVTYNSDFWIDNLNKMFSNLGEWLSEIIIVDNGSIDNSVDKLFLNEKMFIIKNEKPVSYAAAVNKGCRKATGDLFFIINPDVFITKSALFSLINFYMDHPDAGAIVPKLMLMRTPGFINGLGNIVPFFRWGYDLGLGHLDVGQFDDMKEVPSACFATVLIPKPSWEAVGELDEDYPMYYEDSDWSYRARKIGYKLFAVCSSRVFHACNVKNEKFEVINDQKLVNVTFSKLKYVSKHFSNSKAVFFIFGYFIHDILFSMFQLFVKHQSSNLNAITSGWKKFFKYKNNIRRVNLSEEINTAIKLNIRQMNPKVKNGIPILKSSSLH